MSGEVLWVELVADADRVILALIERDLIVIRPDLRHRDRHRAASRHLDLDHVDEAPPALHNPYLFLKEHDAIWVSVPQTDGERTPISNKQREDHVPLGKLRGVLASGRCRVSEEFGCKVTRA